MQAYLVYAPEDSEFVHRLAHDLEAEGVACTLADADTPEQFQAMQAASTIVVALSAASVSDARVLSTLDAAFQAGKRIVGLRIGPFEKLPSMLRGILPLNFSDDNSYDDGLATLLDDLQPPPPPPEPVLPPEIRKALASERKTDRLRGVELLGQKRRELDADVLEVAQQRLRDMAFKDPDSSVKTIARTTLQLISTPPDQPASTKPLAPPKPPPPKAMPITEAVVNPVMPAAPEEPEQPDLPPPTPHSPSLSVKPLWSCRQWAYLPIVGVILALLQATYTRQVVFALPIALVWITLSWFNVAIRDQGRLDWKMPGPVVGNSLLGFILGGAIIAISSLLADLEPVDALVVLALIVTYSGAIGWLSSLYVWQGDQ